MDDIDDDYVLCVFEEEKKSNYYYLLNAPRYGYIATKTMAGYAYSFICWTLSKKT